MNEKSIVTSKKSFLILTAILMIYVLNSCNVDNVVVEQPQKIEVESFSLQNVKLKILLPVENPNNFSFNIKSVDFNVKLNGEKLGKIDKIDKIKIPAKSKNVYPIMIDISVKDAVLAGAKLLNLTKSPKIEIHGTVTVSKLGIQKRIAVKHEQNISL